MRLGIVLILLLTMCPMAYGEERFVFKDEEVVWLDKNGFQGTRSYIPMLTDKKIGKQYLILTNSVIKLEKEKNEENTFTCPTCGSVGHIAPVR